MENYFRSIEKEKKQSVYCTLVNDSQCRRAKCYVKLYQSIGLKQRWKNSSKLQILYNLSSATTQIEYVSWFQHLGKLRGVKKRYHFTNTRTNKILNGSERKKRWKNVLYMHVFCSILNKMRTLWKFVCYLSNFYAVICCFSSFHSEPWYLSDREKLLRSAGKKDATLSLKT